MCAAMYFLFANPQKPETINAARELAGVIESAGEGVVLDAWLHDQLNIGHKASLNDLKRASIDCIISLGGDGTLLRTLPTAALENIPVLGINMGRVGFLLEVDDMDLNLMVKRLISKDYQLEHRHMLSAHIVGRKEEYLVMNDVVLCRGGNPSSIRVENYANDELVYVTDGDGVIVASATGSTGYCLSAGGPVLHPTLRNLVLLPICSHKAQQLPIVFDEKIHVRLKSSAGPGRTQQILFDGQTSLELPGTVEVSVSLSKERVNFIRFAPQHFYTRLRLKQAEWSGK